MSRLDRFKWFVLTLLTWMIAGTPTVMGAPQSETFLPDQTKLYLSIPDMDRLFEHLDRTQIGQLAKDQNLQPFFKDLQKQLSEKWVDGHFRFELTTQELREVRSGEVALAIIQPVLADAKDGRRREKLPGVLLVDVREREEAAKKLLTKIAQRLTENGATAQDPVKLETAEILPFQFPRKPLKSPVHVYYSLINGWMVVGNELAVTKQIVERIEKPTQRKSRTLAAVKSFQQVTARCSEAQQDYGPYHLRWFVEPFGLEKTLRASIKHTEQGTNYAKVLYDQGFSAIQAAGGHVTFATKDHELFHCSYVYAPPVVAGGNRQARYAKAARMLDFANPDNIALAAEDWVMPTAASYVSTTWNLSSAFNGFGFLVDAIAQEENYFDQVLKGIKEDPNSSQVDIQQEIIDKLDNRVTVITDVKTPITPRSERWVVAIKIKDQAANIASVQTALEKMYDHGEGVQKHKYDSIPVWEELKGDEDDQWHNGIEGVPDLVADDEPTQSQEPKDGLNAWAVAGGYLLISTDAKYLGELIQNRTGEKKSLKSNSDYQAVNAALDQLSNQADSTRQFGRPDRLLRTSYELIRQGAMPQSKSVLGYLLNHWMQPAENKTHRKQQVDGSKLPEDYDRLVAPSLGAAGWCVKTKQDGWLVLGCMLAKQGHKQGEHRDVHGPNVIEHADDESLE